MGANGELIEQVYAGLNARDLGRLPELAHADIEWQANPRDPEQEVARGFEGVMAKAAEMFEAFDRMETRVEELIETDDGVVACVRHHARGRESGVEVDRTEVHVWRIRDGKVSRFEEYEKREQAFAAVGLEPEQSR